MNFIDKDKTTLLKMMVKDPKIRKYAFQKMKGVEWFDALVEYGLLKPEDNPLPVKEGDYVRTPTWPALNYLINTLKDTDEYGLDYKEKIYDFIKDVTANTSTERSNYRTWWNFAEMLPYLADLTDEEFIATYISKWLPGYQSSLTISELTKRYYPKLVELGKEKEAIKFVDVVTDIRKLDNSVAFKQFEFYGDEYWINQFLEEGLGENSDIELDLIDLFDNRLREMFMSATSLDESCVFWRGGIEDVEQDKYRKNEPQHIFISIKNILLIDFTL